MQAIGHENNLSETAFFVAEGDSFDLRWFTPRYEVDPCVHATLAAAFVVFNEIGTKENRVRFESRSRLLEVAQDGERLSMDFPALPMIPCPNPPTPLVEGLGIAPNAL